MPLTPELMKLMDNGHLIAAVRCELDPLTSTPLELELLNRLEAALDTAIDFSPVSDEMEAQGIEQTELIEMIKALEDHYVIDAASLREKLKRADDFYTIAADLQGDVLSRLNTLIQSTQ
jgi:hypothetical protein